MNSVVDVLLFRLGPFHLAVELHLVSSILALEESYGMGQLDPRPFLKDSSDHPALHDPIEELDDIYRVGLIVGGGPPMVLLLEEVLGARAVKKRDILMMPRWARQYLPPILRPACIEVDEKVVWLLDLDTLQTTPAPE